MKKTIAIVLALALCLSLIACGGSDVEKALEGKWEPKSGNGGIYVFDNGRFSCMVSIGGLTLDPREGSYEISGNVIKLHYDNGVDGELEFTYSNGNLSIDGLVKK